MTDNKKGLAVTSDQAPEHKAKPKFDFTLFALNLIAYSGFAIVALTLGVNIGTMLVRSWGG